MKKFTGYCPLYTKEIAEGLCIKIQVQVYGLMKDDEIKILKKHSKISDTQIKDTCENRPNLITE
jgi:hypothetical protein